MEYKPLVSREDGGKLITRRQRKIDRNDSFKFNRELHSSRTRKKDASEK